MRASPPMMLLAAANITACWPTQHASPAEAIADAAPIKAEPTSAPPTPPAIPPTPVTPTTSALPTTMDAAAAWRTLAATMPVQAAPAATPGPLQWSIPTCELTYALQTTINFVGEGGPGGQEGIFFDARITAAPLTTSPTTWELSLAPRTGFITGKTRSPASELPSNSFASPRISTDGSTWRELDGPTSMWSAAASSPGLVIFFPALPQPPHGDAATPWPMLKHSAQASYPVEAARGSLKLPAEPLPPAPAPMTIDARVQLLRWLTVAGQPAAELAASWTVAEAAADPPAQLEATGRFEGHYVVLASGRLLHASVRGLIDTTMQHSSQPALKTRHDHTHELRLVSACDGPVTPSPVLNKSPEERGLIALSALSNALLAGDRTQARSLLSPKLIAAHGQPLVDLLVLHMQRFGPSALGDPGLMPPMGLRNADGHVTIEHMGAQNGPDFPQIETTVIVDTTGPAAQIESVRTTLPDDSVQLELSSERLSSSAAGFKPVPTPPRTVLTTSNSVQASEQRFTLARRGDDLCAFKLRDDAVFTARYDWYAKKLTDPGPLATGKHGSGELSEQEPHNEQLACGPISITWSAGGHMYFADDRTIDLATTTATTIESLDPTAADIVWLSNRWGQLAYEHAADTAVQAALRARR